MPLYAGVTITDALKSGLYVFITSEAHIDCFCVDCQQPSVFLSPEVDIGVSPYSFDLKDRIFTRAFVCSWVHWRIAYFHFRLQRKILSKIGLFW